MFPKLWPRWDLLQSFWIFNVKNIKTDLSIVFDNLNYLQPILNIINSTLWTSKIDIDFDTWRNQFIIKNDKIKIYTIWSSINSILNNWKEILEVPITVFDLEKTLKLIK